MRYVQIKKTEGSPFFLFKKYLYLISRRINRHFYINKEKRPDIHKMFMVLLIRMKREGSTNDLEKEKGENLKLIGLIIFALSAVRTARNLA